MLVAAGCGSGEESSGRSAQAVAGFRALCDGIRFQVAVSARYGSESPISKEELHDSACTGCGTV